MRREDSFVITLLRAKHWIKNLSIFAGPFFALKLFDLINFGKLTLGFIYWCMVSSAIYIFNDLIDRKEDALHPNKCKRPIAAGLIDIKKAYSLFIILGFISIILSFKLSLFFLIFIISYFLLNIIYSIWLKHIFILDVMCIAFCFVFRIISGAVLINIRFSECLIICTFLLALLLGFGKRQEEITSLKNYAAYHRKVLEKYNRGFLKRISYVLVLSTGVCYILYIVSPEAIRKFNTKNLIYTMPFLIYGLFKYIYITYKENKVIIFNQVLFRNIPIVILWFIITGLIIYIK